MKSFEEKSKTFSPEAQKRISEGAQRIREELSILRAIREAAGISQDELADKLEVGQSYISKVERRENVTLSTITAVVRALGGRVDIIGKLRFLPKSNFLPS